MYVCMYTRAYYVDVCVSVCIMMYVRSRTCTDIMYIQVCIFTCVCVSIRIRTYPSVCAYVYASVHNIVRKDNIAILASIIIEVIFIIKLKFSWLSCSY